MDIDQKGAFNYEAFEDNLYPHRKNYMKLILEEVQLVKIQN